HVDKMDSTYRVTKSGELREVQAKIVIEIQGQEVKATVAGTVENRRLTPHLHIESRLIRDRDLQLDPIDVPEHHSMLSTMQPWSRLTDVRPNQRWQITLFDPLSDSIAAALPGPSGGPRVLQAGVRERTDQDYLIVRDRETPCIVIEYRGDNLKALTWIRESDGLVLRQEVIRNEDTPLEEKLSLERDVQ